MCPVNRTRAPPPPAPTPHSLSAFCSITLINGFSLRKPFRGKRSGKHVKTRPFSKDRINVSTTKPRRQADQKNLINVNRQVFRDKCSIALINARSIRSNSDIINEFLSSGNADIVAFTETWIKKSHADIYMNEITPENSSFLHVDRPDRNGGGVELLCPNHFKPKLCTSHDYPSFESMTANLETERGVVRICVLYKPPSRSFRSFCNEFIGEPQNFIYTISSG